MQCLGKRLIRFGALNKVCCFVYLFGKIKEGEVMVCYGKLTASVWFWGSVKLER